MSTRISRIASLVLFLCICAAGKISAQVGFKLTTDDATTVDAMTKQDTLTHNGKVDTVYQTISIIEYRYSVARMKPGEDSVTRIMNELSANTRDPAHLFPKELVRLKEDTLARLNTEIVEMKKEQDSLYAAYVEEYVNYRNLIVFPGVLRSRAVFNVIYDTDGERFKAMGNSGIQFGTSGTASIYSEIVSGNMGLIRVGFGAMLTSDDSGNDSTAQSDQAYQRLITNGGNTILTLEYPLLYANGYNNQLNAIIRPIIKGTADLPAFGTSTDKWAGSGMFGFDVYADAALDNNQLRFFTNVSSFYVRGTSTYQSNLGVTSPDFSFGQWTAGIVFLENFKVSIIIATWSTQAILRNRFVAIGGQVLR